MRIRTHFVSLLPLLLLASLAPCLPGAIRETALDTYVHAPDSHYSYELIKKSRQPGGAVFLIQMTSQQWRKPGEVDRTLWKHWLTIYKPASVITSTGMLFITGGLNKDEHPKPSAELASIAETTHSVVAELRDVPNQTLTFTGDPYGPRKEDEIIAYTWRKFLETGDETWPLRLPMTKAAVRAMDTVTSFAASKDGGGVKVDRFFVAGASKRGWTTWTTAAVDPRVVAIAPMVIDVLNVVPSFRHHYGSYGFWATSVKNYYDEKLMDEINSPNYAKLMAIEDPFSYRERFTMPKLLINASGDQFFLPDSAKFYFDKLPGESHLLYEANADHSLKGTDVIESLTAFYQSVIDASPRPKVEWKMQPEGTLRVTVSQTPATVRLWQATNPDHRDFRLEAIGPAYRETALNAVSPNVYEIRVPRPEKGWTAFFVELTFTASGRFPFKFTTPVYVVPDVEPYVLPLHGETKIEQRRAAAPAAPPAASSPR